MNDILSCFPNGFTPREQQKEIIKEIEEYEKSYDKIILCMPTGSGKSPVAYALGKYFNPAFILTSTKHLQDQYKSSFPTVPLIKGKNNFKCEYLINIKKPENTGLDAFVADDNLTDSLAVFKRDKLTCDYGPCTKKQGNVDEICEFKEGGCDYYIQRNIGMSSSLAILNYALYFQLMMSPHPIPGIERECIIYDEAHELEDQILNFVSLGISKKHMDDTEFFIRETEVKNIDDVKELVDLMSRRYSRILSDIDMGINPKKLSYPKIEKMFEKYRFIYGEMDTNMDNFVYTAEFELGYLKKLDINPLDISRYTKNFFTPQKQFFMSATIDKDNFTSLLGLDASEIKLLEIKESPFLLSHRPVIFSNIRELSRDSTPEDNTSILSEIESIMRKHNNQRGLILSSNKTRCKFIINNISPDLKLRLVEGHSNNDDGTTVNHSMKLHASKRNGVLVSSSMWQGIDLKGDLGEFCILEKCPFPNLGDKRIHKKAHQNWNWYTYKTIIRILQGMGRCVREETDIATVYCLDTQIDNKLKNNCSMIPQSFHDMLFSDMRKERK